MEKKKTQRKGGVYLATDRTREQLVESMLAAELAELVHFKSVGVVLLVLLGVVIALFALCTSHCYLYSHIGTSY